ncbi:hypothetical protein Cme02nite_20660 [Catellatospora methionotrophica]|uniref:Uncharacterized protein n=1 Tax=Catellatospora methionotrophica TaxID=121620 RepID=A0A8J3LDY0_9ACTN|nr:hypothetical protein [Catellatospora methionotrophica]GIG13734.1 hypothetical protein Cme02nite_20660 [Catellatospora methionotrophica]
MKVDWSGAVGLSGIVGGLILFAITNDGSQVPDDASAVAAFLVIGGALLLIEAAIRHKKSD